MPTKTAPLAKAPAKPPPAKAGSSSTKAPTPAPHDPSKEIVKPADPVALSSALKQVQAEIKKYGGDILHSTFGTAAVGKNFSPLCTTGMGVTATLPNGVKIKDFATGLQGSIAATKGRIVWIVRWDYDPNDKAKGEHINAQVSVDGKKTLVLAIPTGGPLIPGSTDAYYRSLLAFSKDCGYTQAQRDSAADKAKYMLECVKRGWDRWCSMMGWH